MGQGSTPTLGRTIVPAVATPGGSPSARGSARVGGRRRTLGLAAALAYMGPYVASMSALAVVALAFGIVVSLFRYSALNGFHLQYVGLANLRNALSDPIFLSSLVFTGLLLVIPTLLQVFGGLVLAVAVGQYLRPITSKLVQPFLIVPLFVSPVVAGLLWRVMFTPNVGLFASGGLATINWLGSPLLARIVVFGADLWAWTPFAFVLLLAAVKTLPGTTYEAARLDGASEWTLFWRITVPQLRGAMFTALALEVVNGLYTLPLIYALTSGGPGTSTEPLNYYGFSVGFEQFNLGYAAALFLYLLVIAAIPASALALRLRRETT